MSAPWPPKPDLESIQDLLRAADPEHHLAEGAPADEYDPEAEEIVAAIENLPVDALIAPNLLPILEQVWRRSFELDDTAMLSRRAALSGLAEQIARFFGPGAKPQTR